MRILAFSDLHRDLEQAARLTEMSAEADVVIGAGDFASIHNGLEETIGALAGIETPTVLVAGNNETVDELRRAATAWPAATVLHGESVEIAGQTFYGLGGGIPTTPWSWSFDLDESEAESALAGLGPDSVLVVHSPPKGHCDEAGDGLHLGSNAILHAIERGRAEAGRLRPHPRVLGTDVQVGDTEVVNLGPAGRYFDIA